MKRKQAKMSEGVALVRRGFAALNPAAPLRPAAFLFSN
jgi:hypothetical protein